MVHLIHFGVELRFRFRDKTGDRMEIFRSTKIPVSVTLIGYNNIIYELPIHGLMLHGRCSELGPWHVSPPLAGAGLSHSLSRVSIPSPHVALQLDQLP